MTGPEYHGMRHLSVQPDSNGGSLIILKTAKFVPDILQITAKEREQLIRWLQNHPIPFATVI